MAKSFSNTSRRQMSSVQVNNAVKAFRNPSRWPEWNTVAQNLLASKPDAMEEGDRLAVFQTIKGSLIETKWVVNSIREGDDFCEIELLGEGQFRNERQIAKGLKNLRVCITFLSADDGGIEVYSSCEVSRLMAVFGKQINRFVKQKTDQFLNDLSKVE